MDDGEDSGTEMPEERPAHRYLGLAEIETETLRLLLRAVDALKEAEKLTKDGLASDHMHNAAAEIRHAMRMVGG